MFDWILGYIIYMGIGINYAAFIDYFGKDEKNESKLGNISIHTLLWPICVPVTLAEILINRIRRK